MVHVFKKRIALGTIISLNLLVGALHAVPQKPAPCSSGQGMLTAALQSSYAQMAVVPLLAHTADTLGSRWVNGAWPKNALPVQFTNKGDGEERTFGLRLGAFGVTASVPAKKAERFATVLRTINTAVSVEGVTPRNVGLTVLTGYALKVAAGFVANRLSK